MSKIWITRNELSRMIKEALSDTDWSSQVPEEMPKQPSKPASSKPKLPPFDPRPGQERVLEPDPKKAKAQPQKAPSPSKPASSPRVIPGGDVGRSRWVGPRGKSYSREELAQGLDVTGDSAAEFSDDDLSWLGEPGQNDQKKPSLRDRMKGIFGSSSSKSSSTNDSGGSEEIGSTSKGPASPRRGSSQTILRPSGRVKHFNELGSDPTASEPYTKDELDQGDDIVSEPKSPSFRDRLKGVFGGSSPKGYEEAPSHWSSKQKEKFHRDRAIGHRDKLNQYKKMFNDADGVGDEKKKSYAKKMHRFYSDASNEHERALKGTKR